VAISSRKRGIAVLCLVLYEEILHKPRKVGDGRSGLGGWGDGGGGGGGGGGGDTFSICYIDADMLSLNHSKVGRV
jgi:hypothetical protein